LFSRPRDLNPLKEEIHDGSEKESRKEKEKALKVSGAKSPYSREIVVTGVQPSNTLFYFSRLSVDVLLIGNIISAQAPSSGPLCPKIPGARRAKYLPAK
jgi:hypothetical protein